LLILTQYYPPEVGAAQVRLAALATELVRAGHEVEVVTALPNYPAGSLRPGDRRRLRRRETIDGIPVTRLWLYAAKGAGVRRLLSHLSFTATGLVGALAVRRPDVVFVESPPLFLGIAGWLVARRYGARFVLNVSDLWPDTVRDMGLMQSGPWLSLAERLERFLYRRATAVTAVTEGIRDRLVAAKGVEPARVLFLPNGVDTATFRPLDSPSATAGRRPSVVYIGTHGLAHGLDVIPDAAQRAPEIDFLLVGDGTEKDRLQREVTARSLSNVTFRDPVAPADVAALYADAVAGLSTLRRSPLMQGVRPAKVLAAMACGRPVLYAGSGEGADLVRGADAGVVVEPEDPVALANAARALVADPVRAAEMGANGRRYVAQHLGWPSLVTAWLEQLSQVMASDRG
jgi:glycosyltransferase involved in cell wall biosynthesis